MKNAYAEQCIEEATEGMEYFLRNFSFVPEDHLTFRVTPTAKTPIEIAAHVAVFPARFARMIRDMELPSPDNLDEWLSQVRAEEAAIQSRDQMIEVFRQGTSTVIEALEGVSPEQTAISLDTGFGWKMPVTRLMRLPGWHATLHAGQIDFLQTCWGDQQIYV